MDYFAHHSAQHIAGLNAQTALMVVAAVAIIAMKVVISRGKNES